EVVVVDGCSSLRCRPLQPPAKAPAHFSREVLPAGIPVLACERELSFTKGDRPLVRELLGLFPERFERRAGRKGLRSRQDDLLSSNRLYPADTRLKEGPHATRLRPEQVGMFPCRGEVAPCQLAPRSIGGRPRRCQTTKLLAAQRRDRIDG